MTSTAVPFMPLGSRHYILSKGGTRRARSTSLFGTSAITNQNGISYIGVPIIFYGQGLTFACSMKSGNCKQSRMYYDPKVYQRSKLVHEGMSMTKGKFDGKTETIAVAKPGLTGQVIFYKPGKDTSIAKLTDSIENTELRCYFGYSMTAGDFDGDKSDDLVVAAPWSDVMLPAMFTKQVAFDAGKVFIYYSPLTKDKRETLVLDGHTTQAYFGYSTFCPGDLNQDGYSDLIVGAPYESRGSIYIYYGSSMGLRSAPSQVISEPNMFGFGFSISGGHDVDSNGFPDIVVGAIKNDSAILIRSAPVFKLIGDISFNSSGKLFLDHERCPVNFQGKYYNTSCFTLTVQLQYVSSVINTNISFMLDITLDKEREHSRLLFKSNSNRRLQLTRTLMNNEKKQDPIEYRVFLTPNMLKIEKHVIHTTMSVTMAPADVVQKDMGYSGSNVRTILPVLDIFPRKEFSTSVSVVCKNDEEDCSRKPDLIFQGSGNETLIVGENLYKVKTYLNSKDAIAFQVQLTMTFPKQFSFLGAQFDSRAISDCNPDPEYSPSSSQFHHTCIIAKKLAIGTQMELELEFQQKPASIVESVFNLGMETFHFNFSVKSNIEDNNYADNILSWELTPNFNSTLHLSSVGIPETTVLWRNISEKSHSIFRKIFDFRTESKSRLKSTDYIGSSFSHKYYILNKGPSPLSYINVTLKIPVILVSSSYPIVLISSFNEPMNAELSCDSVDEKYILETYMTLNANATQLNSTSSHKVKTNAVMDQDSPPPSELIGDNKLEMLELDCDSKSTQLKCLTLNCWSGVFLQDHKIILEVKGKVLASTLKEIGYKQYNMKTSITVQSLTGIKTYATSLIVQIQQPYTLTSFFTDNFWLILINIAVGVFIILIIIYFLYKAGFFKRSKKEDLITKRRQHHRSIMMQKNAGAEQNPLIGNNSVMAMY